MKDSEQAKNRHFICGNSSVDLKLNLYHMEGFNDIRMSQSSSCLKARCKYRYDIGATNVVRGAFHNVIH